MNNAPALPEITSIEQARDVVKNLFNELQEALWRVNQLEKKLYGSSSEKQSTFSKEQILLSLFPEPETPVVKEIIVDTSVPQPPRPRRHPEAKTLETVTERIEPEEKICPVCGKEKIEIGCEKSERFEYVPAKIVRHEIIRPKLACPCKQSGVSIAPLPPAIIDKGQPGASLLAHVALSKFEDHLPLYRQQKQFERLGVNIPKTTLCDWVDKVAQALEPIVKETKRQIISSGYVQVDETPVKVQDPDHPGKCATGWLWVLSKPGGGVIFEFHPGRGREHAEELLTGFKGYLQRDGYGVYGAMAKNNPALIPVGCWAHARRKFIDALDSGGEDAQLLIAEIRQLYLIEQHARQNNFTAEQRKTLREEKSNPVLELLHSQIEPLREKHLPQSPLGKAISYTLNEWTALNRYVEDGRLQIDNNLTENAIRPSAIGKKNWLFIGHPEAGWRSAVIYSVLGTCHRYGLNPWEYLKDMLTRLPGLKQSELSTLLPWNWKPA